MNVQVDFETLMLLGIKNGGFLDAFNGIEMSYETTLDGNKSRCKVKVDGNEAVIKMVITDNECSVVVESEWLNIEKTFDLSKQELEMYREPDNLLAKLITQLYAKLG